MDTVRKIQCFGIISIRLILVMASDNWNFLNFMAHLLLLHTCLLFSCSPALFDYVSGISASSLPQLFKNSLTKNLKTLLYL